jgi:alkanesulfonate monooxygenase SsuD/methylene tetrahydromethanopterin reductase-like flavin-dependent oxidoreductase (luciferase family)
MYGHTLDDRIGLVEEGVAVLRSAWSGEEFEYRGRRLRITPRRCGPGVRRC